ncbi:MAG: ABC transporter ATP-binding protein, partial [Oscillospiraceae bacterium]|nr:ABC transporter ATP-binding protein [Oscillospiraceae bacterium]
MLNLEHVSFTYAGNQAPSLTDCNLCLKPGEMLLLCGSSGCGKTTLTRLVNGLIPAQIPGQLTGRICLDGQDLTDLPLWRRSDMVGSVFQNPKTQFFNLDTISELAFSLENRGVPRAQMQARLQAVAEAFQLEPLLERSVFELSGGEQQRIALAAAYTQNPDIYVLDEPSANLDEQEILRLQQLLGQLKRQGKSILIAEHRTWYLKDLIDQAIFLAAGEMARQWTGADFAQLTPAACAYWGLRSVQRVKCCVKPACAAKEGAAGLPAKSTKGLSVRQLSVKRQQRYLCTDLSFEMPRGQVVVLQGCNGAGKSSLARVLCGLNKAQAGQIYLDGKKLGPRALRQKSFMIMQEVNYQLFSDSVLAQARLGNHCSEAEALRVLTELQLEGLIQRHPLSLSGGQKQ